MEIEELLGNVKKPFRYTGGEFGSIVKNHAEVRVALAYPDLYEIGMSYIGLRILYFFINSFPYASAERVFMPDIDMVMKMENNNVPLFSLETKTPLKKFDLLAFSLLYELNYTNLLWMLRLSGIPIYREERREGEPIIGAGGPNVINPEPIADFVDFFYFGDGELFFADALPILRETKNREERLGAISEIKGVYIPDPSKRILHPRGHHYMEGIKVKKRVILNPDEFPFPEDAILSHGESVFDRLSWEIARGCPQKCRFCQATQIYAPFRARDINRTANSIVRSLRKTGYEEVSFSSLSTADYPEFHSLLLALYPEFKRWRISVSLPSLRPSILQEPEVASIIADLRKTSFTIVPEAGTERLRSVINKGTSEEEIINAAETAFKLGWKRLKFYFMIGLPTEDEEDIRGIAALLFKISSIGKKLLGKKPLIVTSISNFVPMPWTAFQWLGFEEKKSLREKQRIILNLIKRWKNIKINFHNIDQSFLEAFLSRGDFKAGRVIKRVFERGGILEAWSDHFNFKLWEDAFVDEGVDPAIFTGDFPYDEPLPWDHMDPGVYKEYLKIEFQRALKGEKTPSCLDLLCGRCRGCEYWKVARKRFPSKIELKEKLFPRKEEGRFLYLIEYQKKGVAKYLSQTDILKTMERIFRRSGAPVSFSQGFHPKPRISLPPALPLGVEGEKELAEVEFTSQISEKDLEVWNSKTIEGLKFISVKRTDRKVISKLQGAFYSSPVEEREKIEMMGFEICEERDKEIVFIHKFGTPSPARRSRELGISLLFRRIGFLW